MVLDVLAHQRRCALIVVDHVARQRPYQAWSRTDEHAMNTNAVALTTTLDRDNGVTILGQAQMQQLAGGQVSSDSVLELHLIERPFPRGCNEAATKIPRTQFPARMVGWRRRDVGLARWRGKRKCELVFVNGWKRRRLVCASRRHPGIVVGHPGEIAECGVPFQKMLSAGSLWIKNLSLCSY